MQITFRVNWDRLGELYKLTAEQIAQLREMEWDIEQACMQAIADQVWESVREVKEGKEGDTNGE